MISLFGTVGVDHEKLERDLVEARERRRLVDYQNEMAPRWHCRIGTVRQWSVFDGAKRRYLKPGTWMI